MPTRQPAPPARLAPVENSQENKQPTMISTAPPVKHKADLANLIPLQTTLPATAVPTTERELIARALGEVDQTRTWNLLIDVVAQTGHFKPNGANLQNDVVVEGEQHYWVNIAIDRFTGQVIDKQIEVVNE